MTRGHQAIGKCKICIQADQFKQPVKRLHKFIEEAAHEKA